MNAVDKNNIREALESYLVKHGITQNEFSKKTSINVSYISNIRAGNTSIGKTAIADKYYEMIADAIGYVLKKEYWSTKETEQLLRILPTLEDARQYGETQVLLGETGCGKTFCAELFAKRYPTDVFYVKVGSNDNLGDLLEKIIDKLKISTGRTKSKRIRDIIKYFNKLKYDGQKPMIILDECEYMKIPTINAIKELYDSLVDICAIVLIGTEQFSDKLLHYVKKNKEGMPQFYRRIKFGMVVLPSIDTSFSIFLEGLPLEVKRFLKEKCENYGELNKVLVKSLREADRMDQPLSVELIKTVFGSDSLMMLQ